MSKKETRTYDDGVRAGAEAVWAAVLSALDSWIVNNRHAGNPMADLAIRWRDSHLKPAVEQTIASLVATPKPDISAGLEPKPEARE